MKSGLRKSKLRKLIGEKTGKVFTFLSDYLLFQLLFWIELPTAGYGSRNVYKASERATEEFFRIKGEQARTAVNNLRSGGYIRFARGGSDPAITKKGLERLRRKLPIYEKKRPWNGKLYLVIYDVSTKRNALRDRLRRVIEKLGCAMLQDSVWLTPYDPREVLKGFVERNRLYGSVIVSEIGKDGAIGGETFTDLVWKIYQLDSLNRRYKKLIEDASELDPHRLALGYLSVLKDDPQLPFELLPKSWNGTKAYKLCRGYLEGMWSKVNLLSTHVHDRYTFLFDELRLRAREVG